MTAPSKIGTRRRHWLEWLLALSLVSLIAQIAWEPLKDWSRRPQPGALGIIHLVHGRHQPEDQMSAVEAACMVYLPKEFGRERRVWPLIIYLHGSRSPDQTLEMVRAGGLPAIVDRGRDLPAVVAAPVSRPRESWRPSDVIRVLDELLAKYPVDNHAVYLTGYSMGGYGAWEVAAYAPERFAAVVPLCGGGDAAWASKLAGLPVWAFHGEHDGVIPTSEGRAMTDAVVAAGGDCRFTVIPNASHDICSVVYEMEELYDWLFARDRR